MADFSTTYNRFIQPNEGYFANLTGDSGGITYGGITKTYNANWNGWPIVDEYVRQKGGLSAMRNNERVYDADPYVSDFYNQLWHDTLMDEINSQDVANIFFDFIVNSGKRTAIKHIQQLVGTTVDGIIGNKTINAINQSNSTDLYNQIKADRAVFYNVLASNNPNDVSFLTGWLNRLAAFPDVKNVSISVIAFLTVIVVIFLIIKPK